MEQLRGVGSEEIDELMAQLQGAAMCSDEAKKGVLTQFLLSNTTHKANPTIDLDPNRTRLEMERANERILVQKRKERLPAKLGALQRKRADFNNNLLKADTSEESRCEGESVEDDGGLTFAAKAVKEGHPSILPTKPQASILPTRAPAEILPSRPQLLFDSFLPVDVNTELTQEHEKQAMENHSDSKDELPDIRASRSIKQEPPGPTHLDLNIPQVTSNGIEGDPKLESLMDEDVDELLNWSKKLGMDQDDAFLFE